MITRQVTLINKLGLHARAASKLVGLASRYDAGLSIGHPGTSAVDGKNIMTVLMLAAGCGTALVITCDGHDEEALADAVCSLVANRFDEGE